MSARRRDEVVVHLDAPELAASGPVGWLRRSGFGQTADLAFEYAPAWLGGEGTFPLDPYLDLVAGEHRRRGGGLFGIFSDAAPDHWGRDLLKRRERLLAQRDRRAARALDEWDYLLGVSDLTRMGALRFAHAADERFLDDSPLQVPPQTRLREMEVIAAEVERNVPMDLSDLDRWLRLLIAPGASLGGARPKATFADEQGALWIAKFPSRNDERDVGAWEFALNQLAGRAGIATPETDIRRLGREGSTFCARRFDRVGADRRPFASAMTLLDRRDHEAGASYLDIAAAIEVYGSARREEIDADLEQLFRRAVFNALAGNRDDHLRNHGFLRGTAGWRLAPAYDLNPVPAKLEHELAFDEATRAPDLAVIERTAPLYRIARGHAGAMIREVRSAVGEWRVVARAAGISRDEIEATASAFSA